MALDPRKRQKKLMKKRQKDKARRARLVSEQTRASMAATGRIMGARSMPIRECLINPDWKESGMARISLCRTQPDGRLLLGNYLVDLQCLGLKDAFCKSDLSVSQYEGFRERIVEESDAEDCPVGLAHEIIYGAVDFARRFGFEPHPDFELSQHVLENRDQVVLAGLVEFGRDGKPFYVSGPDDNVEWVLNQLRTKAGEGNYDCLVGEELDDEF